MGILRWPFAGLVAVLVGLGFAVLTQSVFLAAVPAAGALLIAAYLSWEGRPLDRATRGVNRRGLSAESGYVAPFDDTTDEGVASGGDSGFGGDGGGSLGGDGGAGGR